MGHMRFHVLAVTEYVSSDDTFDVLWQLAASIGLPVTPIMQSSVNGHRTFVVTPSGSKLGWPNDEKYLAGCAEVIEQIKAAEADGSAFLDWVFVEYGGDGNRAVFIDGGDI